MAKKYELTDETRAVAERTLHRVRAMRDIPTVGVKAGDLGGWIEREDNLSHDGSAWVSGDAQVYGGSWEKSPLYIQGTKHAVYMATNKRFAIGCQQFTFAVWEKRWRRIAEEHWYTPEEVLEYAGYYNLACDRYGQEKRKIDLDELRKELGVA